jgi:hypothetical protein
MEITKQIGNMEVIFHVNPVKESVEWDKHLRTPEENIEIAHWLDANMSEFLMDEALRMVTIRVNAIYIGPKGSSKQEFVTVVPADIFNEMVEKDPQMVDKAIENMLKKTTEAETEAYGGLYQMQEWEEIIFDPRPLRGDFLNELNTLKNGKGTDNIG